MREKRTLLTVAAWLLLAGGFFALPAPAGAQEAVIAGTVADTTGGVLPGVLVTAVHTATGTTFTAVTNEAGNFRIAARVGVFRITAELPGFTVVERTNVELLLGQTATLRFELSLTGVAETITVTSEAPLLEVTSSAIGGNIDPRQMQELPVQGRAWTNLALLAPGNRTTAMGAQPVEDRQDVRDFQVNMDGVQVTNMLGPGGQPRFSRDAIAEFVFVSNRFDATQGRSAGAQVNAISKSGTNTFSGTFGSYFRNSSWNAEDHVLGRVVPYENQQFSTTLGGPIVLDRIHFFGNYEYEREPRTQFATTAWPAFNVGLSGKNTVHMGGARVDWSLSGNTRLMLKWNHAYFYQPFGNLGGNHPQTADGSNTTKGYVAQLTNVIGNRALNQFQVGVTGYQFDNTPTTHWSNHPMAAQGITQGGPRINLLGFNIQGGQSHPWYWSQDQYTVRNEFSYSYSARGQHGLKVGGEFIWDDKLSRNCTGCMGQIDARNGPVPANIEALFPDPFNADTWNLNALSPLVTRYQITVGERENVSARPMFGFWLQDDWQITGNLTVNLGVRYDLIWDAFANEVEVLPWMIGGRPQDADNIQPRFGFAYQASDRMVVRGGIGLYYGEPIGSAFSWSMRMRDLIYIGIPNDGRPDFASNPFNGPIPTHAQAYQQLCHVNNMAPGCLERDGLELAPPAEYANLNQAWQMTLGFQRQFLGNMVIEMDYAHNRNTNEKVISDNVNLTYNPATGVNYPFSDRSRRVYPEWGAVGHYIHNGRSNYHGLQSTLTKRFSNNWQASANYLLSALRNVAPSQPLSGHSEVPFAVAPDLGNEYGLAVTDQRHRVVFNGIYQVGRGFQVSGLYFFGSGQRFSTSCGGDRRGIGAAEQHAVPRLCADGTIVPRNNFVQDPVHRVDVRFQQRVPVGNRVRAEAQFELFNLFNRANYGAYTTVTTNPRYGLPNASTNLAFAARTVQLGFRLTY